jgi:hypothetical protein
VDDSTGVDCVKRQAGARSDRNDLIERGQNARAMSGCGEFGDGRAGDELENQVEVVVLVEQVAYRGHGARVLESLKQLRLSSEQVSRV